MNETIQNTTTDMVFQLCKQSFEKIQFKFESIDSRFVELEKQLKYIKQTIGKNQTQSFVKIEDKIDYLNKNCKHIIESDYLLYVHNELSKDKYQQMIDKDIINILNYHKTIYEVSCHYLCMIAKEIYNDAFEKLHLLYAFPYQQYTLYYWNCDKFSWDKINQEILNKLFNLFQQHILNRYSILISNPNDERLKHIDIIESGSNLYVDNFNKKYTEFKKMIFLELIS